MKVFLAATILISLSLICFAQEPKPQPAIANKDIVEMLKSGHIYKLASKLSLFR
jgi:hypothetical protein